MPKNEIDYSNTIIYKITCKNPEVFDVYVGHTTNFVQRKHTHKICCNDSKSPVYNCQLYEIIRNNGGWNNWQMEIINIFNCRDHYEAMQKEQEYFVTLNATLNNINPSLKPKPKLKVNSNISNKPETNINTKKCFNCINCNFITHKLYDYKRHLQTEKHKQSNEESNEQSHELPNEQTNNIKSFACKCGKEYTFSSGLSKHKKLCQQKDISVDLLLDIINKDNEIKDFLLEQNKQVIDKLTEQNNKLIEQNNKLIQIAENNKPNIISNNNTINTTNFNLNVFLNETCKDALNITDFVESLVLKVNDLEETARLGYTNGILKYLLTG